MYALSDDADMEKQLRSLYRKAYSLLDKFSHCSEKVRVYLFQMYCGTMYCSSLWCKFKQSTYNKLRVAYNNAFRILMFLPKWCSASEMFVTRRATSFEALLRKARFSLISRTANASNMYLNNLLCTSTAFKSDLYNLYLNSVFTWSTSEKWTLP